MCALVVKRSLGENIFNRLNGLIAVYKPADMNIEEIKSKLKYLFAQSLNDMPCRPIEKMVKIDEDNNSIYITENMADSPLAVGPRYLRRDFRIDFLNRLSDDASGVQICSVNDTHDLLKRVYNMRLTRVYHLHGRLGVATHNFSPYGKVVEKSTYDHVTRASMDRIMSAIQSTYQREMYNYFGIKLDSQEAFDLASQGLLRPKDHKTPPIIYSIRCIKLKKPQFTIEINTINEKILFLKELIHDIGYRLKTNAICAHVRRVRDGFIDINSCVTHIDWNNFDKIYANLNQVNKLAYDNLKTTNKTILIGKNKQDEANVLNNNATINNKIEVKYQNNYDKSD